MNRQTFVLSVFAMIASAALAWWLLQNLELKEVEEYTGFQGEAKSNQLFAARLFIKRMGIPAERQERLSKLPPTDTVILLDTQRYTFTPAQIRDLLAWVARGGHLITRARVPSAAVLAEEASDADDADTDTPATPAPVNDPLQQALGISIGAEVIPDEADLPLVAQLSGMGHALTVDPEFFFALQDTTHQAFPLRYQDSAWLLEITHGKGLITLAANLDFISNSSIAKYDHAEFLWYMLHSLHAEPAGVWLLHNDDLPPLWRLIWERAWALVLSLAMFIPLTLLAFSPRFGAILPTPEPERRRILEHIEASGRHMWQRAQQGDPRYQAFTQRVTQLFPSTRTPPHDNTHPDA